MLEIQEIIESINSWERALKVLAWHEGKTSEVEAVTGTRVIQKARFTVRNGRIMRCYECLLKVTARVNSDRVSYILEHIKDRNISLPVYDATKIWFRIAFDAASAGETYTASTERTRVEKHEVLSKILVLQGSSWLKSLSLPSSARRQHDSWS